MKSLQNFKTLQNFQTFTNLIIIKKMSSNFKVKFEWKKCHVTQTFNWNSAALGINKSFSRKKEAFVSIKV